jgi:hypothetical protein
MWPRPPAPITTTLAPGRREPLPKSVIRGKRRIGERRCADRIEALDPHE